MDISHLYLALQFPNSFKKKYQCLVSAATDLHNREESGRRLMTRTTLMEKLEVRQAGIPMGCCANHIVFVVVHGAVNPP